MHNNKLKILMAMSGGVDSAVAAKLLKDQGHEVIGIFLHFWKEDNTSFEEGTMPNFENKCCSSQALNDARRVAKKIGIPLYTLNFARIFKKQVVDNFLTEYSVGHTPNPCVRCNKLVKLGYLIKQAKKLGFDYVASGHYARLRRESPVLKSQFSKNTNSKYIYKLYKAKDKAKDQSYFLYTLNQEELKHLLFPLANFTKTQVRQMAEKFKLPVAEKPESQEICFIRGKSHNEFLRRYLKMKPGPIVILEGAASRQRPIESHLSLTPQDSIASLSLRSRMTGKKIIGRHQGLPLYTIGQRQGIGIGGSGPYYAAKMDYRKNILYVVNNGRDKNIFKDNLIAKNLNWLSGVAPASLTCQAVIRYRHQAVFCRLKKINDKTYAVKFKQPQRAVTPGQSVVFYRGREVLGGGVIK